MNKMLCVILTLSCTMPALAQHEPDDTVAARELREIVVEAPAVIRKADMDVYRPARSVLGKSANGM